MSHYQASRMRDSLCCIPCGILIVTLPCIALRICLNESVNESIKRHSLLIDPKNVGTSDNPQSERSKITSSFISGVKASGDNCLIGFDERIRTC